MATKDTPAAVDATLAAVSAEVKAARPDDYVIALTGSKRISFKYPMTFKRSERKAFIDMLNRVRSGDGDEEEFLATMLSPADLKAYDDLDLDYDVHEAFIEKVIAHFDLWRTARNEGKGNASES